MVDKTLSAKNRLINEAEELIANYFDEDQLIDIANAFPNFDEQLELIRDSVQANGHDSLLMLFTTAYDQEIEVFLNVIMEKFPEIQSAKAREGLNLEPIGEEDLKRISQRGGKGIPFGKMPSDKQIKELQLDYIERGVPKTRKIKFTEFTRLVEGKKTTQFSVSWSDSELTYIRSRIKKEQTPQEIFLGFRRWSREKEFFPRTKTGIKNKIHVEKNKLKKEGVI